MTGSREIRVQDGADYGATASRRLERWLVELLPTVAPDAESFGARLAGDDEVLRWNRELRGVDRATDVLSFAGEETPEGRHLGDVLISLPTARAQAAQQGHSVEREIKELLLHGVLHCLGYDHETDNGQMVSAELELRERWIEDE